MIRKDLVIIYVDIRKILFKIRNICNYMSMSILPYSVSNIPVWDKLRVY